MTRACVLRLYLVGLLILPTSVAAETPIVKVDCLCVSMGEGKAEGMTTRSIGLNSPEMHAIVDNALVVVLEPTQTPGETQQRACDRLTEIHHVKQRPYVPWSKSIRIEFGALIIMKSGSDYKTSLLGFIKE